MTTKAIKIHRLTALPGTLEPDSIYYIAPAGKPNYVETYIVGNIAGSVRRVINEDDILTMIQSAITAANELVVVPTIAARNALAPDTTVWVYVEDATADPTVTSGGATYLYNTGNSQWLKTSESESLDISLTWGAIAGRPNSSPAAIDAAVGASHTHANMTELGKIGQDASGNLTYDGALPHVGWDSAGW